MEEKLAATVKRDKWREKNYIKGLTLTRKSCEGLSPRFSGLSQRIADLTLCLFKDFRLLVQEYEDLAD